MVCFLPPGQAVRTKSVSNLSKQSKADRNKTIFPFFLWQNWSNLSAEFGLSSNYLSLQGLMETELHNLLSDLTSLKDSLSDSSHQSLIDKVNCVGSKINFFFVENIRYCQFS